MKCIASFARLSIPISTAVVFTMAAQVSSAAILSDPTEASFNGGFTLGEGTTLATISSNSLFFSAQTAPISLSQQEGSFLSSFNSASIGNIQSFGDPLVVDDPFFDFGNLAPIPGVVGFGGEGSIADGVNTFSLSDIFFNVAQSGANVSVDLALYGTFIDEFGNTSDGAGNITLQANDVTVQEFADVIASGGSFTSTFSGAIFDSSVLDFSKEGLNTTLLGAAEFETVEAGAKAAPEPTTFFGTALVLGLGNSFKKVLSSKLSKEEK